MAHYRQGLALSRPGGNVNLILLSLEGRSGALRAMGRSEIAARLWGTVTAIRETHGIAVIPRDREAY